jgi:quinol-cytochrome oxidoreductase complex cytochrome b subunit
MFTMTYLLFCIFLLLFLGAVIAFSYFVIKPFQTRWAIIKARKMVAAKKVENTWQFRNVYRMLATARNDLEAAKLWKQLDEMKEAADKTSP